MTNVILHDGPKKKEMLFLGVDLTNLTLACCELFVLRSMIEEYNNDSIGIVSDEQNKY